MSGRESSSVAENPFALSLRSQLQIACVCAAAVCLGGCATTQHAMRLEPSSGSAPTRIVLVEAPLAVDPGRLREVLAPDINSESPASAQPISQGKKHAQDYARASMQMALDKTGRFALAVPKAKQSEVITAIQGKQFAMPISQCEADNLRASTGADAVLLFELTDYGLTPQSWRKGYITFEVASTLAIAGAIAYTGSKVAKAAAGAYLAQETVEETAESYAGFWALDVVLRPVRIEAELVRLHPVATVWKSSDTGLSDVSLARLTRKVSSVERTRQLDQATGKAIADLVSDLSHAMEQIKPSSNLN